MMLLIACKTDGRSKHQEFAGYNFKLKFIITVSSLFSSNSKFEAAHLLPVMLLTHTTYLPVPSSLLLCVRVVNVRERESEYFRNNTLQ